MQAGRGKWERLARELAETYRELAQLEDRTLRLRGRRVDLERKLREELEKEAAPLGPEVYNAQQEAEQYRWRSPICAGGISGCMMPGPHMHGVGER
jgi:hypothetical protein